MNNTNLNMDSNSDIHPKTRIDEDGIEVKWDEDKRAWFPNIDDEFIYKHNLSYGFVAKEENKVEVNEPPPVQPEWLVRLTKDFLDICKSENIDLTTLPLEEYSNKWYKFYSENAEKYQKNKIKSKKRPAKANDPTWFEVDENKNKYIYIENLPLDITMDEFVELVSKYGLLMYEPFTNIPKVKLYTDQDGNQKGDAKCCYLKIESVDLALNLLDEYNLRGNILKVSRAKFEKKGDFDPKKRRRITNKEKRKLLKQQDSLFRWGPETKTIRPMKDNTVILKNVFDTELMKTNPDLAIDIKEKITKETKNIGAVKSIQVHDLHPEAVVQINFKDANLSDIAVEYFNNKIWNSRNITAEMWDGKTKYKVKETAEEEKERIEKWEQRLESRKTNDDENAESSEIGIDKIDVSINDAIESNPDSESLESVLKVLQGDVKNETENPPLHDSYDYDNDKEGSEDNLESSSNGLDIEDVKTEIF